MNKLILLILIAFGNSFTSFTQCDYNYLKAKIISKIAKDNGESDTSFYLGDIKTGEKVKKWRGDQYNDTVAFGFRKDCYLRFYLITSGLDKGKSYLKLIHNNNPSNNFKLRTGVILKEVANSQGEEIVVFEYYLKETENLILVLNQQINTPGCSFASIIQYRKKHK